MYKATIRALLRHAVKKLNAGDYSMLLKMASADFELAFPGDNSWATSFRPVQRSRHQHVTHRGIVEATAFAERFVSEGIQFQIEEILVNGGPWKIRVAMRVHDFIPATDDGHDIYNNRAIAFLEIRWGRLVRWEDYEDTQRVADWDNQRTGGTTDRSPRSVARPH